MEKKINIAAVQHCAELGDKYKNYDKIKNAVKSIKNADIIILPEVWTIGWNCGKFRESAEDIGSSETLTFLADLAKEHNANIIGGSFITKNPDGNCYNTSPVFDRTGKLIAIYNKNHLYSYFGSTEAQYITVGESPVLVGIDGYKIGLTVCYDIRFPEIYRAYRIAGADVLVNCAAWASTKPSQWEIMTRSRAIENQTYMIAVNQVGPMGGNKFNLGHSRIIDYNGKVLSEILDGEGVIQSELDLDEMYDFRDKCRVIEDLRESYEVVCKNL